MPRAPRHTPGGYVYHVLNRGIARRTLFHKPADYDAFRRVPEESLQRHPTRLLAYCLMPTHWRFVFWPKHDGQLTNLLRWLTLTHSDRWHTHYHSIGSGNVYQNRFKAFAVAEDEYLYAVLCYVERNPVQAGLVRRAQDLGVDVATGSAGLCRTRQRETMEVNKPALVQTRANIAARQDEGNR